MYSLEDRSFCLHQLDFTGSCLRRDQRDSDAHRDGLWESNSGDMHSR